MDSSNIFGVPLHVLEQTAADGDPLQIAKEQLDYAGYMLEGLDIAQAHQAIHRATYMIERQRQWERDHPAGR